MSNPYNIYYDMQTNCFYRLNKQTGDSVRAYLNGENLPSFKPNITGFQSRRQKCLSDLSSMSHRLSRPSISPSPPIQAASNISSFATIAHKTASEYKPKVEQTIQSERVGRNHHQIWSTFNRNWKQTGDDNPSNQLAQKIILYQTIVEEKAKMNNSPRKDIDGSVDKKDMLDYLCITKKSFNDPDHPHPKPPKKAYPKGSHRGVRKLAEEYRMENQISRQRVIKFAGVKATQTQFQFKSLERDKMRRKNLIKLQREMLRKNSVLESHIFGSDGQ